MIIPREPQAAGHVSAHYDELDRYYLEIWGEHVHHGLWETGKESPNEATAALITRVAERLRLQEGERVCDAGCGYGGTARVLASEHRVHVTGVTLSSAQYRYAVDQSDAIAAAFVLGDFLAVDLPREGFDAAISIESSEHMGDKPAFFSKLHGILRPGGRMACMAWLARDNPKDWQVRRLLEPICREGRLPGMGDEQDYRVLLDEAGFGGIQFEDYTRQVKKTWLIVAWRMAKRIALDREARAFLRQGPENRVFAKTVLRILLAYETGAMRYGLFTARKPG